MSLTKSSSTVLIVLLSLLCLFNRQVRAEEEQVAAAEPFVNEQAEENNEEEGIMRKRAPFGGGSCVNEGDCNYNGNCSGGVCVCQPNYAGYQCEHKLKSKLTAFLLAFFVGQYGAMRFYLGYVGDGVGKIILIVGGIFLCCVGICAGAIGGGVVGGASGNAGLQLGCGIPMLICVICFIFIAFCALLASWLWWIIDWGLVLSDKMDDNDGYPLEIDM